MNLASFLAETKKRVFRKFLLTKTYWILANQKKQKGSVLAEKLGIRIISMSVYDSLIVYIYI